MTLRKVREPDIETIKRQFRAYSLPVLDAESKELLMEFPNGRVAAHLNRKGREFFDAGNYGRALAYFNGAVAKKPDDDVLWVNRAECLQRMKRFDEAIGSADRALELNPNNVNGLNVRGVLYANTENPWKALEYFNRADTLEPGNKVIEENIRRLLRKKLEGLGELWKLS